MPKHIPHINRCVISREENTKCQIKTSPVFSLRLWLQFLMLVLQDVSRTLLYVRRFVTFCFSSFAGPRHRMERHLHYRTKKLAFATFAQSERRWGNRLSGAYLVSCLLIWNLLYSQLDLIVDIKYLYGGGGGYGTEALKCKSHWEITAHKNILKISMIIKNKTNIKSITF